MYIVYRLLAFAGILVPILSTHAQDLNWKAQPNRTALFVENQGQFVTDRYAATEIRYGAEEGSTLILFRDNGWTWRLKDSYLEDVPLEELSLLPPSIYSGATMLNDPERKQRRVTQIIDIDITLRGANPNARPVGREKSEAWYNYATESGPALNKVPTWEVLYYEDIYPGIDLEFRFHPDEGIKYNFFIDAGADPAQIAMEVEGANALSLHDDAKMLLVDTDLWEVSERIPGSWYSDGHTGIVDVRYKLENNILRFDLGNYNAVHPVTIDPWTVFPTLPADNRVFDIAKNCDGDIWIYGGSPPYRVQRYTNAGTLVWTAVTGVSQWYGHLEIDPTNNAYITQGWPPQTAKFSPAGANLFTNNTGGNYEYWRLQYNPNNGQMVVIGGYFNGKISNVNMTTGAVTGTANISAVEVRGMVLAPNGNYYILGQANNLIAITAGFAPIFSIPAYPFTYNSPTYANGPNTTAGQNIVAADANFLYTTDGAVLQQRNLATGAVLNSVAVPFGVFESNAGLDIDTCGNVYVGSQNGVYKFNSALTQQAFVATPGVVYDVLVGFGGEVLVAGNGFLASVDMAACPACLVLPVERIQLQAQPAAQHVELAWTFEGDIGVAEFRVERSRDFAATEPVATRDGAGQLQGSLQARDRAPLTGRSYYRVAYTDLNGASGHSDWVAVDYFPAHAPEMLLYPQPANDAVEIALSVEAQQDVALTLTDMAGRIVRRQKAGLQNGTNRLQLDLQGLPAGMYMLRLRGARFARTARLIVE